METKIYAVYRGRIPNEVKKLLLGSNGSKLTNLLSFGPTIKIRARQGGMGIPLGECEEKHNKMKIYPLLGPKLDLAALNPKPEIEIVVGD